MGKIKQYMKEGDLSMCWSLKCALFEKIRSISIIFARFHSSYLRFLCSIHNICKGNYLQENFDYLLFYTNILSITLPKWVSAIVWWVFCWTVGRFWMCFFSVKPSAPKRKSLKISFHKTHAFGRSLGTNKQTYKLTHILLI